MMGDCITTYTGKHFNPVKPDKNLICVEDIAHALSLICRGNGHVKTFFSVGQHCINCAKEAKARGLSERMILACLLHDASECYLSDVPRPFKKSLKEYNVQEKVLLDLIFEKFLGSTLTEEEQRMVKEIDDAMLWFDLKYLLNESVSEKEPAVHIVIDYTVQPFDKTEKEYLELFERLQ